MDCMKAAINVFEILSLALLQFRRLQACFAKRVLVKYAFLTPLI